MKKINFTAGIILISIFISANLFAGAWTQKAKSGFYKLGLRYINTTNYYDEDGNKIEIPKLTDLFVALYGEYGISDDITLIANLALLESIKIDDLKNNGLILTKGGSNSGVADSELGLRYRICLLYTSPSPRDRTRSRMPSSA